MVAANPEVFAGFSHEETSALQLMMSHPDRFRRGITLDTDNGPAQDVWDDWQRTDFAALDQACLNVQDPQNAKPCKRRHWWERPKGHSKTTDIAVVATWLLFACHRRVSGIVAAGDKEQAALLRKAIEQLVILNPWLKAEQVSKDKWTGFLDVQRDRVVNPNTKSELVIVSSDVATSHGVLCDFIVCDEVTHWKGSDLWESYFTSADKRKHCILLAIQNAGFVDSWQYTLREKLRVDPEWHFSRLEGPSASWITAEQLAHQERLSVNRISFERFWLNIWAQSSGDALDPNWIERAIRKCASLNESFGAEWQFFAGLDASKSRDKTALAIVACHVGTCEEIETEEDEELDQLANLTPTQRAMWDLGFLDLPEPDEENELEDDEENPPQYQVVEGTGKIKLVELHLWAPTRGRGKGGAKEIDFAIR